MNVLMFLHDAYGGHGGISRNNRDVLDALVHDSRVERITALPRIAGDGSDPIPAKVDWRVGAAGGTRAFLAESLRAIFGPRPDLILAAHIRLLPVAYLAKLVTGAPLWLFIYGIDAWDKPKNPLLTWLARRVDRVISISEVTTQRFQSWAKSPEDRYPPAALHGRSRALPARRPRSGARRPLWSGRQAGALHLRPPRQRAARQGHGRGNAGNARFAVGISRIWSISSAAAGLTGRASKQRPRRWAWPIESSSPGAFPRRRSWPIIIWPTPMSCRAGARDLGS